MAEEIPMLRTSEMRMWWACCTTTPGVRWKSVVDRRDHLYPYRPTRTRSTLRCHSGRYLCARPFNVLRIKQVKRPGDCIRRTQPSYSDLTFSARSIAVSIISSMWSRYVLAFSMSATIGHSSSGNILLMARLLAQAVKSGRGRG